MPLYIYAITRADEPDIELPPGVAGQPVTRVVSGPLGAFVSEYSASTIRAERRHIAPSQSVLRVLQGAMDLLPTAFGTLTPDADAMAALLDRNQEKLLAQLERIAGAVEMGVRLSMDVPDPIAYLLELSPELRQARDRLFSRRKTPSHEERIRLGQLCDGVLRRYQESQSERLVAQLTPASTSIMTLPIQGDKQIANLAVLVPRTGVQEFESAVQVIADGFDDRLAFALNGPWPPYNFVQLELDSQ